MTHDELLAKVQFNQNYQMGIEGYQICSALRVVVELHEPDHSGLCGWCTCRDCTHMVSYPCKTIRAIEGAFE